MSKKIFFLRHAKSSWEMDLDDINRPLNERGINDIIKIGKKFKVHLPEKYSDKPGTPVDAVIVDIPFKESYNANTREVVSG